MRPVDMDALMDLLNTLERGVVDRPQYLVRRPVMPAGVLLYDLDRQGRRFAYVADEVLSKLPMAPFTGTALTALAGLSVFDAPLDV